MRPHRQLPNCSFASPRFGALGALHTCASVLFLVGSVVRLMTACITQREATPFERQALAALVLGVPLTSIPWIYKSPPRWKGVFVTSLFTSLYCSTALWVQEKKRGSLHPALAIIWAASLLQTVWRCIYYPTEVKDAARVGNHEEKVFRSISTLQIGGVALPCTVLNQAYMVLISPLLYESAGTDAVLALALSDFLCVYQLFLARRGSFPLEYFKDSAAIVSGVPGAAVLASSGHHQCAIILTLALSLWLTLGKLGKQNQMNLRDSTDKQRKPS